MIIKGLNNKDKNDINSISHFNTFFLNIIFTSYNLTHILYKYKEGQDQLRINLNDMFHRCDTFI